MLYFDTTTDDLFTLFIKAPDPVYWLDEEEGKIIGGCGIYPTPDSSGRMCRTGKIIPPSFKKR
jgi:hypothetical protein